MSEQRYLHILAAIVAASKLDESALDIERAYALLDTYVEHELAGQPAAEQMPEVAYFILADPDFAEIYRSLSGHLEMFDSDELPEVTFDMGRLTARRDQALALAPEDVVRPAPPETIPDPRHNRAATLIPHWQRTLPRFSSAFKSAAPSGSFQAPVPDQAEATSMEVIVTRAAGLLNLDGRIVPSRDELVGQPVHLYRLELASEPEASRVGECPIDDFDRFSFAGIPAGVYVLALAVDDNVIGAIWLDLS